MPRLKHSKEKKKQDSNSSFIVLNPNDNYFNDDNSSIFDFDDSDKKNNTLSSPRIVGSLSAYASSDNINNSTKNNNTVKEKDNEVEKLNSIQQLIKDYNNSNEELQKLINQFKEGNKKFNDKAHLRTESNKENYSYNSDYNHPSSNKYSKHGRSVSYNPSRTNSQTFPEKLIRKGSVNNSSQGHWLKSPPMSPTLLNTDNKNSSSPTNQKTRSNSRSNSNTSLMESSSLVDPTKVKAGSTRIKQSPLTKQACHSKNIPNQKRIKPKSSFTNLSKNSILDIMNAIPSSFNEPNELSGTDQDEKRRESYDSDSSSTTTTALSTSRSIDYEKSSFNLFNMTTNENRLKKSQSTSACSVSNESKLPDFFYDTPNYLNGNTSNKKRDLFPSVRLNSSDSHTVPSLRDKNGYIIQNSSSVHPINIPITDINDINNASSLKDHNDEHGFKNDNSFLTSSISSSPTFSQIDTEKRQRLKRSESASLRSRTKEGYLVLNIKKPSSVSHFDSMQHSYSEGMINTSLSRNNDIHNSFSQNNHNIRECEDRPYNTTSSSSSNIYPSHKNEKLMNMYSNNYNNNNNESIFLPSSPPPQNYPYNYSHPHSHTMRRSDDHLNYRQTQYSGKEYHHLNHHPSRNRIDITPSGERERQTLPLYIKPSRSKSKSKSKTLTSNSTVKEDHPSSDSSFCSAQESVTIVPSKISMKSSLISMYKSLLYLIHNFYRQCQQHVMKILSRLSPSTRTITSETSTVPLRSNSEIHLHLNTKKNDTFSSLYLLLHNYYKQYLLPPVQPILNQIQDIWLKLHLPIPKNSTAWCYTTSVVLPAMVIVLYQYRKLKLNQRTEKATPKLSSSPSPIITTNRS